MLFHINYNSLFLLFFFITTQIQFGQCTINSQSFTYHLCSFYSNTVTYLFNLFFIFIIIIHYFTPHFFLFFVSFHNYFFYFSFFLITTQIQCSQCTITFQSFTYHLGSFCSNKFIYLFHLNILSFSLSAFFTFLPFLSFHHNSYPMLALELHFLSAIHTII